MLYALCGEQQPRPVDYPMPTVIEETREGARTYDLYSMLVKNRIVLIGTPIDGTLADLVVAELLYLQQEDPERDIQLYLNCPGGEVDAGLAIYDAMHLVQPQVATICVGSAIGIAALLLAGGARHKRAALPNAHIMIHQPSIQLEGTAADIDVRAREILRLNARLTESLAVETGQTDEQITRDISRDFWMNAQEALEYGLIDKIVGQHPHDSAAAAKTR